MIRETFSAASQKPALLCPAGTGHANVGCVGDLGPWRGVSGWRLRLLALDARIILGLDKISLVKTCAGC